MLNMPNNPNPQMPHALEPEVVQVTALEAISRAEINQSIATARQYARILPQVKQKMMNFACLDEETAASCFYSLPRGGKNIQGPSVRLAEIAVCCYGNLRAGTRIIETVTTGDSPHVTIQAVAMDLESNASITIEKRRRIIGKKSAGGAISEDDINLAANAGSAIAFRDSVFKIVPLAIIKPVYEAAKRVAIGDAKSLGDRRARCVESFGKMGISKERILSKLEKKSLEDIGLEDLETLIGLYTAIKDNELTLDEAFPATATQAAKPSASAPAPVNLAQKPAAAPTQPAQATGTGAVNTPAAAPTQAATGPEAAKPAETAPAAPTPANASQEPPADAAAAPVEAVDPQNAGEALAYVSEFAARDQVTADQVMSYMRDRKLAKPGQTLSDMSGPKLIALAKGWSVQDATGKTVCQRIKELAGAAA